jgi:hypothetical protein
MKRTMPEAFDEWLDRYINQPELFNREFQVVQKHLEETAHGDHDRSYGKACEAYLTKIMEGE